MKAPKFPKMHNVGIVVENLDAAITFFTELGLEFEGRAPIEGAWAEGVTGLRDMRVEMAMMRTPDGHSRLELSRFLAPPVAADHRVAPVNALGYLRVMFTVKDVDDTVARLRQHGADHRVAPVNALGYLRVMFTVKDVDDTVARLRQHGAEVVGSVVQYEEAYRLCYIRGPEGILIGLAEELGPQA